MTEDRIHLHHDDHPATLALLTALADGRPGHDWIEIGWEPTEHGAWVDWTRLANSSLSSTEQAVIHVARGCATLERAGGPSPRLSEPLRRTITAVTPDVQLPAGWLPPETQMRAGIRVSHADPDQHDYYAQLFASLAGTIIHIEHSTDTDGEHVTHTAAIVTAIDDHTISYVAYHRDDLDVAGWDAAMQLVTDHPELHTITNTPWQHVTRIHIW